MNQQISFWDVSKSTLGYLKTQLDQMDELKYDSSEQFKTFESTQKVYLNSCKKLVQITQDRVIENCSEFIKQRKEYQQTLEQTQRLIAETYYGFPNQKCYFSIAIAHGIFTRQTFPYMPNCINKFCKTQKNITKQIFRILLNYEQPAKYNVDVIDSTIEISNSYFSIILDYYEEIFYFNSFELLDKKLIQTLSMIGSDFIKEFCNKIAEQLPIIQKEEYFLLYLCYFIENLIKIVQAQVSKAQQQLNQNFIIINACQSLQDFQNNRQTTITYLCQKKTSYQEIIIQSNNNYYLLLQPQVENFDSINLSWNIEDDLNNILLNTHKMEEFKQQCTKMLRTKNINLPIYFKINFEFSSKITLLHNDPKIDNIFNLTKCYSYLTFTPFKITFDSNFQKIELYYKNNVDYIKLPITLNDQHFLLNQFQINQDPWDYLRWIIVRTAGLDVNKKLVSIKLTKEGNIIFLLKQGKQIYESRLTQNGFSSNNEILPIIEIFPSFEDIIDVKKITKILEKKLIDSKFASIQNYYNNL